MELMNRKPTQKIEMDEAMHGAFLEFLQGRGKGADCSHIEDAQMRLIDTKP